MKCFPDSMDDFDGLVTQDGQYLDQFEIDLDFCLTEFKSPRCRDDDDSSEDVTSRPSSKRMKLRLPKHDIRRYYSNMFLNVINSANFDYILPYFSNFMNPGGKFVLEYVAPNQPRVRTMNMVADGAQATAYYLMGLGVMFPDMSIQATSGQVVTSNAWAGCKLVLETTFNYTKIYDVSFEKALAQLSVTYQPYKDRKMLDEARVQRTIGQTDCEAARLTLSSHNTSFMSTSTECDSICDNNTVSIQSMAISGGTGSRSSSMDTTELAAGPVPAPHMVLTSKVHEVFTRQKTLAEPIAISARCRFVIVLDERNHINQITVSAVQDHAQPVPHNPLRNSAI